MFDYEGRCFENGEKPELGIILRNRLNLKSVHIDTYIASPYIFLLRSTENELTATIDGDRVVVKKRDEHGTTVSNMPFDMIADVRFRLMNNRCFQMFFTICNVCYRVIAELC